MNVRRLAAFALATISLSGCAAQFQSFRSDGFYTNGHPYMISYRAGSSELLPSSWRLDNFVLDGSGKPTTEKRGGDYQVDLQVTASAKDGRQVDVTLPSYSYDLRYFHRHSDGAIWFRTVTIDEKDGERSLSVLADRLVDSIAGGNYFATSLRPGTVQERRYATTVIEQRAAQVAGADAWEVTFEVANVDQLQLNPDAREARLKLFLVRPPFKRRLRERRPDMAGYTDSNGPELPVVMVLGYANSPESFHESEAEFDDLVSRVRFIPRN